MPQDKALSQLWEDQQQRWDRYQQPKLLWLWSAVASAALTVAAGFTAGGWTTRVEAERMVTQAVDRARVEIVADACVANFAKAYAFEMRLAALQRAPELQRTAMLQNDGWVTLAGMNEPLAAAAVLCADRLIHRPQSSEPANAMTTSEASNG